MTRRSQTIRANILEFDDDFERKLRRARSQQEHHPPTSESDLEENVQEEEEEATAGIFEEVQGMAMDNRTLKELSASGLDNATPLCIQYPRAAQGKTDEFELKSSLLHHIPKYHGLSMEDPNKHLKEFEVVCSSMTPVNVDGNILKMKAFPFSLMDKAKDWLYELAPGTVTSWESMKRAFLEKFFPTSRHVSEKCPQLIENGEWESANAIGFQGQNQSRHDPYSNTYNPGWRDHPNFKWREPQQHQNQGGFRQQPPGFFPKTYGPPQNQPQSGPSASGTSLDNDALLKILTKLSNGQEDQAKAMQRQDKRVDQLEKQIGQIAEFVGQFREQGKLPSSTIANPKGGFETANAIMLRSGKEVGAGPTSKTGHNEDELLKLEEEASKQPTAKVEQPLPQAPMAPKLSNPSTLGKMSPSLVNSNIIPPNVPFPSRFLQSKNEEEEKDVLETFRKVQVNIPLLDAIKQIPKYAKCLKKLCTTKKRFREKEVVQVSENVSAMIQRKLPPKCKDPGSFTIPCVIGNTRFKSAMLDLGASINVMPYSIYASMNLGKLKNDGVIIQLADRSNAYPKGVLEDVLVQVNHLVFPADFYVLEMDESDHAPSLPILLGRPFMKTAQTKIDVAKGEVTMAFGGDMICFKIPESIETPNVVRSCCVIDKIEKIGTDHSAPSTKVASRTMQDEGIGVEHKDPTATAFKIPNVAENTMREKVHVAATSSQHQGKEPSPNPIPIKIKRWFPSWVQVPAQLPDGGLIYMDCRMLNAPIKEKYYPLPFIELEDEIPLDAVGSNGA
ncbi:unnamed protein product [Malus baccata var. baccata]